MQLIKENSNISFANVDFREEGFGKKKESMSRKIVKKILLVILFGTMAMGLYSFFSGISESDKRSEVWEGLVDNMHIDSQGGRQDSLIKQDNLNEKPAHNRIEAEIQDRMRDSRIDRLRNIEIGPAKPKVKPKGVNLRDRNGNIIGQKLFAHGMRPDEMNKEDEIVDETQHNVEIRPRQHNAFLDERRNNINLQRPDLNVQNHIDINKNIHQNFERDDNVRDSNNDGNNAQIENDVEIERGDNENDIDDHFHDTGFQVDTDRNVNIQENIQRGGDGLNNNEDDIVDRNNEKGYEIKGDDENEGENNYNVVYQRKKGDPKAAVINRNGNVIGHEHQKDFLNMKPRHKEVVDDSYVTEAPFKGKIRPDAAFFGQDGDVKREDTEMDRLSAFQSRMGLKSPFVKHSFNWNDPLGKHKAILRHFGNHGVNPALEDKKSDKNKHGKVLDAFANIDRQKLWGNRGSGGMNHHIVPTLKPPAPHVIGRHGNLGDMGGEKQLMGHNHNNQFNNLNSNGIGNENNLGERRGMLGNLNDGQHAGLSNRNFGHQGFGNIGPPMSNHRMPMQNQGAPFANDGGRFRRPSVPPQRFGNQRPMNDDGNNRFQNPNRFGGGAQSGRLLGLEQLGITQPNRNHESQIRSPINSVQETTINEVQGHQQLPILNQEDEVANTNEEEEALFTLDLQQQLGKFLANCISFKFPSKEGTLCIHPAEANDEVSQKVSATGAWESLSMDQFTQVLESDPALGVIDIGAGIGIYSLAAALMGRKVVAVEPLLVNYRLLHKSAQENNVASKILMVTQALDSTSYTGHMTYLNDARGYPKVQIDKLNSDEEQNDPANNVHVTTLDNLTKAVHFPKALLKLDVGGTMEADILKTGSKLFNTVHVPYIMTHWTKNIDFKAKIAIASKMAALGYRPKIKYDSAVLAPSSLHFSIDFLLWCKQNTE